MLALFYTGKFYHQSDTHTLLKLYVAYIHPHFEYACSVWNPSTIEDTVCVGLFRNLLLRVVRHMIQSMQLTRARLVLTAKSFKFTNALQVRVHGVIKL